MIDDEIIKNAQYRKTLSIAFFNATNAAIELFKGQEPNGELLAKITQTRDFFLEEHKNYYAQNIANIGVNYNTEDTITKLKKAQTVAELKTIWIGLSEDERQDEKIKLEAQSLKKQLL